MAAFYRKKTASEDLSSDAEKCRGYAFERLALRDYGTQELYEKLCIYYTAHTAAETIAAIVADGYLDDAAYAKRLADSLLRKNKSRRAAAEAMAQKKLDKQTITTVLSAVYAASENAENDAEVTAAAELLRRHYLSRNRQLEPEKLIVSLQRKGFSYRTAKQALALACKIE